MPTLFNLIGNEIFPRIPITQVAERHGSGKLALNKGGATGTRIWQCPWWSYPAFLDRLLGRATPLPQAGFQLFSPDVFSPAYPWLYCQDCSMEGEDLLGVDLSGSAFYRRAIVTAKYMPLETGNSIHVHTQMLTVPGTQFVFIGPDPSAPLGTRHGNTITPRGAKVVGGEWKIQISASVPGVTNLVKYTTPALAWNANSAKIRDGMRQAFGLQPKDLPNFVNVSGGPASTTAAIVGTALRALHSAPPWEIEFNGLSINAQYDLMALTEAPLGGAGLTGAFTTVDDWTTLQTRLLANAAGDSTTTGGTSENGGGTSPIRTVSPTLDRVTASVDAVSGQLLDMVQKAPPLFTTPLNLRSANFYVVFMGSPQGKFFLKAQTSTDRIAGPDDPTAGSGRVNFNPATAKDVTSEVMDVRELNRKRLAKALGPIIAACTPNRAQLLLTGGSSEWAKQVSVESCCIMMSDPAVNGVIVPDPPTDDGAPFVSRINAADDVVVVGFFLYRIDGSLNTVTVDNTQLSATRPIYECERKQPLVTDRLDQNVAKTTPMGEITFMRHQVQAAYLPHLLSIIGCVNLFTVLGFPPWTLLLTGIEAKQTRLPNGTPCFDMTFKFAVNPHTHQALFRPATMRWEFVRGIRYTTVPKNVPVSSKPLNAASGRAEINPNAVTAAWPNYEKSGPPRELPSAIDPATGLYRTPQSTTTGPPASSDFQDGSDGNADGQQSMSDTTVGGQSGGWTGGFTNSTFSQQQGQAADYIHSMSDEFPADDGSGSNSPTQEWATEADGLGGVILNSVGVLDGTFPEDQQAGTSGVAYDITQAQADGEEWFNSLEAPPAESEDVYEYSAQVARAEVAHEVGASLTAKQREILGLSTLMGVDPLSNPSQQSPVSQATQNAANVGANTTIEGIGRRVIDVGFIFPMVDFSPLLWLR